MPEYKQLRHSTKAIDGRTVTGIAAVHGNVDEGGDRSWPGAFADTTIDGRNRAVFLWMHNPDNPPTAAINYVKEIPRASLPPAVLAYAPEATGGVEVSRTYLETPRGDEILAGLKAGAIDEMSYAYQPTQYDFEESDGRTIRNLRALQIFDFSDVAWGMNPATVGSKAFWETRPLSDHAEAMDAAIREFMLRVDELKERRAKAGRTFSAANTTRIASIAEDLAKAASDLKAMLDAAAPSDSGKNDALRAYLEYQRAMATFNGVIT